MSDNESPLKKYEVERLVDEKVKMALAEYDKDLWEKIRTNLTIALSKYESAYGVGKFVVVAVALLVIGTLYQIFVTLAQTGVGK